MAAQSDPGAALLDLYGQIRELTKALIAAIERDESEKLDTLLSERAAALDAADRLLAEEGEALRRMPEAWRRGIEEQGRELQDQAERLRAALAAAAGAVPAQLAQVRGARSRLGGYGMTQPERPGLLDRRG